MVASSPWTSTAPSVIRAAVEKFAVGVSDISNRFDLRVLISKRLVECAQLVTGACHRFLVFQVHLAETERSTVD